MTSAPAGTVQSSGSSSQPSGSATDAAEPCRPRGPLAAGGNGTSRSSWSSRLVELVERLDQRQCPSQVGAGGEAVQVPGDVLADVAHALVLAEVIGQQLAVAADDVGDLAQSRRGRARASR